MKIRYLFLLILASLAGQLAAQNINSLSAIIASENIFPMQGEHVHGSSIVVLPGGDLLAVWFQGSGERTADDVRLMGARKKKGAPAWSEPFLMADTKGIPDCNPVLFVNRKGKLFLFWIAVLSNRWESSILRFRTSVHYSGARAPEWDWQDDILFKPGDSFATAVEKDFSELPPPEAGWSGYAPKYDNMIIEASRDLVKRSTGWMTRIPPVTLESGRILLPLYSDGFNFSLVAISDDDGNSWRQSLPIVGRGPIQPSLAVKKDGTIVAWMRDSGDAPSRVQVSTSSDDGETWKPAIKSNIPNEASVGLFSIGNGKWMYVGNDIDDGRYRLSFYISDDEGKTWKWKDIVEYDPARKGSFSYPCIAVDSSGLIHLTYSCSYGDGKKTIKHALIDTSVIERNK